MHRNASLGAEPGRRCIPRGYPFSWWVSGIVGTYIGAIATNFESLRKASRRRFTEIT